MEQKYYTPAKEDLRIGYSLQRRKVVGGNEHSWYDHLISIDDYTCDRFQDDAEIEYVFCDIEKGNARVPYLTAEQIEAEGWGKGEIGQHWLKNITGFKYILTAANTGTQEIETSCPHCWIIQRINPETWIIPNFQVFRGTIRCINDLRLICKLLGI